MRRRRFSINPIRLGQPAGRFGKTPGKARIDVGNRQALGDHEALERFMISARWLIDDTVDGQTADPFEDCNKSFAVEIPNRAAAERADIPSAEAARTRLRRSSLNARDIPISLIRTQGITANSDCHLNSDSAFNGRALVPGRPLSAMQSHYTNTLREKGQHRFCSHNSPFVST
ncbi:hypothetical protein ACVJBD_007250 [Rhizobium mongolense]